MPVGTFTEGAQLIPANTVALLLRACGPRNDAMDESGTDEDSSDLACAVGVSIGCTLTGMTLILISAVAVTRSVAA